MYAHACVYVHAYPCMRVRACRPMRTCMQVCLWRHSPRRCCLHMHMHTHTPTRAGVSLETLTPEMLLRQSRRYPHTEPSRQEEDAKQPWDESLVSITAHALCMHACVHTYVHTFAAACVYVCMHVCTYACMQVSTIANGIYTFAPALVDVDGDGWCACAACAACGACGVHVVCMWCACAGHLSIVMAGGPPHSPETAIRACAHVCVHACVHICVHVYMLVGHL